MRFRKVVRSLPAVLVLAVALPSVALAGEGAPEFEVLVLPPLTVDGMEYPNAVAADLNNFGQVTGYSALWAFRYTPGVGMEIIQPGKGGPATGFRINDRGDVLGMSHDDGHRWFLFGDGFGVDRLRRGLGRDRLDALAVMDINNRGELVGFTHIRNRFVPLLYTREDGWRDLSDVDPRFRLPTAAKWTNDAGDLVFTIARPPVAGADPPRARQQSFVLPVDGSLVKLDDFGSGINVPGDLNDRGELAGLFIDPQGRERPYVFRPGVGIEEIEMGNFRSAIASWITDQGVVGGLARKKRGLDTLFFVATGSGRERGFVRRGEFLGLAREAGSRTINTFPIVTMNERIEFVGTLNARKPTQRIPFLYSPTDGLHAIQSIVDAAGVDLEVQSVTDLNDRGQILIGVVLPEGRSTGAILSRVE